MASLVMAALPVQIAAPILLRATRMSPISAAYTAAVVEDWGLRNQRDVVFNSSTRGSFFPAHWRVSGEKRSPKLRSRKQSRRHETRPRERDRRFRERPRAAPL